jgi:hypothetical protein
MSSWRHLRHTDRLEEQLKNPVAARFYRDLFDGALDNQVDTCDIQWVFASFVQSGLAIIPQVNLVTNIGFGPDATHTRAAGASESNLPVIPMRFPLRHPSSVERNVEADEFTFANSFNLPVTQRQSRAA